MPIVFRCSSVGEFTVKALKLCFYGASGAACLITYTALAAFFALVGGTLGVIVGSLIGLKSERRFLHRAGIMTAVGVLTSVELLKISVAFFYPESNRFFVLGPLFNSATVRVARKLLQEWYDYTPTASTENVTSEDVPVKNIEAPSKRILYTRIGRNELTDSSGNRVCCPICLEDFEFRQVAWKLPCCGNLFHQPCIDKWLNRHNSCPLCRCIVIQKKNHRV